MKRKILVLICTLLCVRHLLAHIVCDCDNLKTKAVIDLSIPEYCNHKEKYSHHKPKWLHYELVSQNKPAYKFDGYICESWVNERTIKGNFWISSYDTVNRQYTRGITLDECKLLIEKKLCANQKAEEHDGTFRYEAQPQERTGYWMSTVTFSVINCMGHKITLTQEKADGPILSPLGILVGASYSNGFHYFNSKVIMWTKSPVERTKWEGCEPHHLYSAFATVTHTKKQGRLVDKAHQLEILFDPEEKVICNKGTDLIIGYSVFGLPGGFVKFKDSFDHKRQEMSSDQRQVIFEENTDKDVEHFIWSPNITRKLMEYMEAVESYEDYVAHGFIYPLGNPNEVLTTTKAQTPMFLDSRWKEGEYYKSQNFTFEKFKIRENIPEVGLCVSSHEIGKNWDPIVWAKGCERVYADEWYKENNAQWKEEQEKWRKESSSEWIYDIENKLIIEIGSSRCLTKVGREVKLKKFDRKTRDVNQQWEFENLDFITTPDSYVDANMLTFDFDDSHLDEYLEFIQGKEQVIEISKESLAHGRLKLFSNQSGKNDELRGCLNIKSEERFSLPTVTNCVDKKMLYNKVIKGRTQDFEHHYDLTIRPTGSNKCLDVLLPKKKSSKKVLFPSAEEEMINSENISNYKEQMVVLNNCVPGSSRWIYDDKTKQLFNIELKSNKVGCLARNGLILIMDV